MNARAPGATGPTQLFPLDIWGDTHPGKVREGNEDAIFPHSDARTYTFRPRPDQLSQKGQLLLVADGVGGARAGSEASRWVRRVIVERYYDSPDPNPFTALPTVIEQANAALYQYLQSTGMPEAGSTVVAAVIFQNTLYVAHVGDSRAYLIRQGKAYPLTRDHTLVELKLQRGLITPEQAATDPDRGVLVRSLGPAPAVQVEVLQQPVPLAPGDVILLCSDGLTDVLTDEEIVHFLNGQSPRRAVQKLIAAANRRGGPDNISVVAARVGGKAAPTPRRKRAGRTGFKASQKWIIAILAALVLMVFGGLAVLMGITSRQQQGGGGTVTPTAAATVVTATAPEGTATSEASGAPAAEVTGSPRPTATPAPTFTPTPTRRPPTPTPTPTFTPLPTTPSPGGGTPPSPPPHRP